MSTPSAKSTAQAVVYTNVNTADFRSDAALQRHRRTQTRRCRAAAQQLGLTIVQEYRDEDRENFLGLIALVSRLHDDRNIQVVIVPSLAAFGHKEMEQDEIIEVIEGCGARVVAADHDHLAEAVGHRTGAPLR